MRHVFDYIFYKSYMWNKWSNDSLKKYGISYNTDLVFDGIWGLSVIQASIVIGVFNFLILVFNIQTEVESILLYIWGGAFLAIYVCNEYYYRRLKKYKRVIEELSRKRFSNIPMLFIILFSLAFVCGSIFLPKQ